LFFLGAALAGGIETSLGAILFSLSALGLLMAGPILVYFTCSKAERQDYFRRIIDYKRIKLQWLLAIILIPPLLVVSGTLLSWAVTGDIAEISQLISPMEFILVGFLFSVVAAPILEEMAWRGYALVEMQKRYSALASSLFLGFMWALWHLPLFFIPGTYQYELGLFNVPFWQFMTAAIAGSVIITWIFNNTNYSTLSAILYHAMWNLCGMLFFTSVLSDVFYALVLTAFAALVVLRFGAKTLTKNGSLYDNRHGTEFE